MFKRFLKSEHTDGRTDTQTDISTYALKRVKTVNRGQSLSKKSKTVKQIFNNGQKQTKTVKKKVNKV